MSTTLCRALRKDDEGGEYRYSPHQTEDFLTRMLFDEHGDEIVADLDADEYEADEDSDLFEAPSIKDLIQRPTGKNGHCASTRSLTVEG